MSTVAELNVDITGSTAGLQSAMNSAAGMAESAGQKMTSAGKAMSIGITAPLAAIATGAIAASTALNRNLANVQSLGVAEEAVNDYKIAVQDMAVSVGKDTEDLGDGLYQVVSAFGDTADTMAILEANAKAAKAGIATTTDAINLTSAVTKGYGDTSAEAVNKVADLAFKTVQLGQTDFPQLAASMGRVVPLGESLGVSMEELFGVMATATGVTGGAAEVSTQLKSVFQGLASPTKDMTKLIKKWGFESGGAAIESMGLQGVIEGITAEAEASGLPLQKYISSIEGQTLALALAGPQADSFTAKLAEMQDSSGAMEEAFIAQTQGINASGFAMEQARIKLQVFMQKIGDGLAPMLNAALNLLTPLADKILGWADAFSKLEPKMQMWIAGLGVAAAAAGPLLLALGSLMPVLGAMAAAIGAVLSPIGLLIAGIAALIAFDVGGIRTAIVGFATAAADAFLKFREQIDVFVGNWDDFKWAAEEAWKAIKWLFSDGSTEIEWMDMFGELAESLGISQEAAQKWAEITADAFEQVRSVIDGVMGVFETFRQVWSGEFGGEAYIEAANAIEDAFGGGAADAVLAVADATKGIYDGFVALAGSAELANIGNLFSDVWTHIQWGFEDGWNIEEFKSVLLADFQGIGEALTNLVNSPAFMEIRTSLTELFDAVGILEPLESIRSGFESFRDSAGEIMAQLTESIRSGFESFRDSAGEIMAQLTVYFEGPLSRLKESFSGLSTIDFQPIIDGFNNLKTAFENVFSGGDGTGGDLLAGLGIAAMQIGIELLATTINNAVAAIQAIVLTIGNVITLIATTMEGVSMLVEALLTNDASLAIEGLKTLLGGLVTFLESTIEVVTNLTGAILESIFDFAGATFEDIGILLEEPEWLNSLLGWTDNMSVPEWVTTLTTWEWERPEWVASLLNFKLPRPGWLDKFDGIVDKLTGWVPGFIPGFQMGTSYAPGGPAIVGESGPELVYLPRGARVVNNRDTMATLGAGGGAQIIIQSMTVRDDRDIWRIAEQLDAIQRRRG